MFNSTHEGDNKLPESKNPASAKQAAAALALKTFKLMDSLQQLSPEILSAIKTSDKRGEDGQAQGTIASQLLADSRQKFSDPANADYRGFIEYDAATMAQVEGTAQALIASAQAVRSAVAETVFSKIDAAAQSGAPEKGVLEKFTRSKGTGLEITLSLTPQAAKYMQGAKDVSEALAGWKPEADALQATWPEAMKSEYVRVRSEFADKTAAILQERIELPLLKEINGKGPEVAGVGT